MHYSYTCIKSKCKIYLVKKLNMKLAMTLKMEFGVISLFVFLRPHLLHVEVPRLGAESELQLLAMP